MSSAHERALNALARRGRLRSLAPRAGIDFASNDYLGLADSAELRAAAAAAIARGVPLGAGGSRLLRGNHAEHEALEAEAAAFFGAESALFFGGGFIANAAVFSTLPQRGDLVIYDDLIHASAHDGMRASKAECRAARHNDCQDVTDIAGRWRAAGGAGRIWIAVESVYSMDGDRAPLDDLARTAARFEATLVIDEAHATGVYGPDGRGLAAHLEGQANVISLHTCGKALGVMGALVLASKPIRDYLVNRARPFIYATAPSPLVAATVRAALDMVRNAADRRERLDALVAVADAELSARLGVRPSGSPIQPIIVGADAAAVALAAALQARGFDVRAVRPPTVPEGTARLRLTITLNASPVDVRNVVGAIADAQAGQAA